MSKDDRHRRRRATPDDDTELFRRAVADARPLAGTVPEPFRRPVKPRARFSRADEQAVLGEILQSPSDEVEGDPADFLAFFRTGVGIRNFRKLRRGRYSVQDEVDLHGMTVVEAREHLQAFLEQALSRRLTCVRIVHGKGRGSGHGGPILKRKVDVWLRQWDRVLAFCSARPADGGTGAVYVLLKRR